MNGDDLGYSFGVNQGIIKAFKDGIVTSTSLMVDEKAAVDGTKLAIQNPNLGLGLHFQINKEELILTKDELPTNTITKAVEKEFFRQLDKFRQLTNKEPDHIDGHKVVDDYLHYNTFPFIMDWCNKNNIPFRWKINFIDTFFGYPDITKISIESLMSIIENLPEGDSELMCHPGLISTAFQTSYFNQREIETVQGNVKLRIPQGTQPDTVFRLAQKGVPHVKGSGKGNHYVRVKVFVPKNISGKQKKLLEEFEEEGKKKHGWF